MRTMFGTERDGKVTYDFVCGCGSEGTLAISVDERGQLGCPDECGSAYIQWKYPDGRWALTCVVGVVMESGR